MKGVLLGDGRPAVSNKVKLQARFPGASDSTWAEGTTNSKGIFNLTGHRVNTGQPDIVVVIFTDEYDGIKPCQRKIRLNVPPDYVTSGTSEAPTYNMGNIDLSKMFPDEERDCVH